MKTALQEFAGDFGVVYFGNGWFGENRTSSHHVAARLSRYATVLYVDCPGLRAPRATSRDWRKIWRILASSFRRPTRLDERFWHTTLLQIPFRKLPGIRALNRVLGALLIRRAVRQLGTRRLISWFLQPHAGMLAGKLGEDLAVYYCTDDYASLPGVDASVIGAMDDDLTRKADLVFVTSTRILERKKALTDRLYLAPHGVDAELFGKAADPNFPVEAHAASLRRPIIGFFGLIAAWIDTELVEFLAKNRPEWTFLLIGSASVPVDHLRALPNVVMPGPQPYPTLPAWAKAFDVAIIPYRLNEQVLSANPLKLREYLATGKPVVTVRTAEVDRFGHCVRTAGSPDGFLAAIEETLANDTRERQIERMQAVAPLTWDARVAEVWGIVRERLR